jgi:hypothetical protein
VSLSCTQAEIFIFRSWLLTELENLQLSAGQDSTIKGTPAEGNSASCADKFVPFPH